MTKLNEEEGEARRRRRGVTRRGDKGTGQARYNDSRDEIREKRLAEKREGRRHAEGELGVSRNRGTKTEGSITRERGQRARQPRTTAVRDTGATTTERHALGRPATCYETTLSDERQYSPTLGTT